MTPVYVAAPFSGPDKAENIHRAERLGRQAVVMGFAPIVVHSSGHQLFGDDEERALAADMVLLELVASHPQGRLWVLQRPDGSLSPGCAAEVARWNLLRPDAPPLRWRIRA